MAVVVIGGLVSSVVLTLLVLPGLVLLVGRRPASPQEDPAPESSPAVAAPAVV
jgi:hypothetical protein